MAHPPTDAPEFGNPRPGFGKYCLLISLFIAYILLSSCSLRSKMVCGSSRDLRLMLAVLRSMSMFLLSFSTPRQNWRLMSSRGRLDFTLV